VYTKTRCHEGNNEDPLNTNDYDGHDFVGSLKPPQRHKILDTNGLATGKLAHFVHGGHPGDSPKLLRRHQSRLAVV
jgi:hypothetical protein